MFGRAESYIPVDYFIQPYFFIGCIMCFQLKNGRFIDYIIIKKTAARNQLGC